MNTISTIKLANVIVVSSMLEGLSLTTIESQIAGVVASTAIPEEAVISDACVRLDINSNKWVDTITNGNTEEVNLDCRSDAYETEKASKVLIDKYMNMVRD